MPNFGHFDALRRFREALVLDNGRTYAQSQAPFQIARFDAWDKGRRVYCESCTGSSKTTDVAAWILSWLALHKGWEAMIYAVDKEQAADILTAGAGFLLRTPGLRQVYGLEVQRNRVLSPLTSSSCSVNASDEASAEGMLADCAIIEQLESWKKEAMWEAIFSRSHKRNCKLIVIANAPPSEDIWPWKVRDMAARNESGMWKFISITADGVPWLTEKELAEKRLGLRPATFARLYFNVIGTADESLFTAEQVDALTVLKGPALAAGQEHRRVVLGLDMGFRRDLTALAVLGERVDGSQDLLDLVAWQGHGADDEVPIKEVRETVYDRVQKYGAFGVVFDPDQLIGEAQTLRALGLRMIEFRFTAKSVNDIANQLYRRGADRGLRIYPNAGPAMRNGRRCDLRDELLSCNMVEGPVGMKIETKGSGTKDRLIALGMASLWLAQNPRRMAPESVPLDEFLKRLEGGGK